MCGLAVSLLAPGKRTPEQLVQIRNCFTKNLIANEERGSDATGVAVISARGYAVILKKPVAASDFVKRPEYEKILQCIDEQTICLLGHDRKPTKGTVFVSSNNHPLIAGNVIGIHNGHIANDDDLFLKWDYQREGDVDSEIIFRSMDEIDPASFDCRAYWSEIYKKLRYFQGRFTFAFIDLRVPEHLIIVKKDQPISVHWDETTKVLHFSSRYIFLRKYFGPGVINQKMEYQKAYCFNAKRLCETKSVPLNAFKIEN